MTPRRALAALACALSLPTQALGQQVRGSVRRAGDSSAVAGALIEASDSSGRVLRRTITGERGDFLFTLPSAGSYSLRVLRIGYRPSPPQPVSVPRGVVSVQIPVEEQPIVLEEMAVTAPTGSCGQATGGTVLAQLFSEAQKAMALTQATLDSRRLTFSVQTWTRHVARNMRTMDSIGTPSFDRGWPIRAAPAESLRIWGFARDEPDSAGKAAMVYYGPDAGVFMADWFLASRCLRLVHSDQPSAITLEFTPARRRSGVDIEGRLVFDSTTLALQELTFHWVGLPDWVPRDVPGGEVRFQRLHSGEWLPVSWALLAPVPEVVIAPSTFRQGIRFAMYLEVGGRAEVVRGRTPER